MKKPLLLTLAIAAVLCASAQSNKSRAKINIPKDKRVLVSSRQALGGLNEAPFNTNGALNYVQANTGFRISQNVAETTIGNTSYDLQTNEAILNRLLKHSDGTMSATWTMIPPGGASAARGTGYNYFDGSSWGPIPTSRIEPTNRTGWPNIVVTPSGKEMVFSHSSSLAGMLIASRPAKGTGAWTEDGSSLGQQPNDLWSQVILGGANGQTVHAIWQGSGTALVPLYGQLGPVMYSRSLDGGATWPILRSLIPAIDSTHSNGYNGDSYSIDAKGDTVAIVIGSFANDLLLLKSIDNGTTWSSTILQSFPISLYDDAVDSLPDLDGNGTSDDIEVPSGDAHVMLDNNGMAHVFWSNILAQDTSAADLLGFFINALDGLLYWNESFGSNAPDTIAFAEDLDGDGNITLASGSAGGGQVGSYRGSITQMPSSGIDASGNIYVSYQTLCENCDTSAFGTSHKHVYVKASSDNGATWNAAYDIDQSTDALNEECAFAAMAKHVDAGGLMHIIYQRDAAPGHSLLTGNTIATTQASWNSNPSEIIYAGVTFPLGVKNISSSSTIGLSQNSPNPVDGFTSIRFSISEKAKVSFEVHDVLGKLVYTEKRGLIDQGSYSILLNTQELSSGVYSYSLFVNDIKETKKMMVK